MKRLLFAFISVVIGLPTLLADDYVYPYLVFTVSDGTQTTLGVSSLEITFSDGQLVATNADGTAKLNLADLVSMQFSEDGELSTIKKDSGIELDDATHELTATVGEDFTAPTLTNPNNLALTWTSSDESVATVDDEGNVTIVGAGSVTITATFAGDDTYAATTVSYTIAVSTYDSIASLAADAEVKVFTVSGILVGTFPSLVEAKAVLKSGLYVVTANSRNYKLSIK